jgi:hypothetical protein
MEHASGALEKIVAGGLRRVEKERAAVVAWPLACGAAVAERTRAISFADGELQVEVPDAGWRKELRALAPQYLAIMNRYVNQPVKRVEFVLAGASATDRTR